MAKVEDERFHPTSGQFMGWLTLVLAALTIVTAVAYGVWWVALGALLASVLAWSSMLRPRLMIENSELVMRNMLETVRIPLAAIEQLTVRQVLAVRTAEKRYVSTAVGKPFRKTIVAGRAMDGPERLGDRAVPGVGSTKAVVPLPHSGEASFGKGMDYADFVEAKVREAISADRDQRAAPHLSEEAATLAAGVRREPAWLEIGLVVVVGLAFLVSLFL